MINKIFWQVDQIGFLANHLEAVAHRHWMMQLFIGIEAPVEITIEGKVIKCESIVIAKNVSHAFSAKKQLYYSALIEPTSEFAEQLTSKVNDQGYWIVERQGLDGLRQQAQELKSDSSIEKYLRFKEELVNYLGLQPFVNQYDERVRQALELLGTCECDDHILANIAAKVHLSPSRLAHLFKEQIGVPLKSYLVLHQLERAFRELFDGKTTTEAALIAGFGTPSHFSSTVKKMMGMPVSFSLKDSEFLKVN